MVMKEIIQSKAMDLNEPEIGGIFAGLVTIISGIAKVFTSRGRKLNTLWDERESNKAKEAEGQKMNDDVFKRLDEQDKALEGLRTDLLVLKTFVIGLDGTNGMRGDLKELKEDFKRMMDRGK